MTRRTPHYWSIGALTAAAGIFPVAVNATSALCENRQLSIEERVDTVDAVFLARVHVTVEKEVPRPDCGKVPGDARTESDTATEAVAASQTTGLADIVRRTRDLEDQYRRILCESAPDRIQLIAFDVLRSWKGVESGKADGILRVGSRSDDLMGAGETWLIFGNRQGDFIRVSTACSDAVPADSPVGKFRIFVLDQVFAGAVPSTEVQTGTSTP